MKNVKHSAALASHSHERPPPRCARPSIEGLRVRQGLPPQRRYTVRMAQRPLPESDFETPRSRTSSCSLRPRRPSDPEEAEEREEREEAGAHPGSAQALRPPDRRRPAAHRGRGARARPAQGRGRRARQAAPDRVQPASRDVDHAQLHEGRRPAARPDPGGQPGPDPRGREVRLEARLQAFDLRDLVDSPGRHPRARRPGPDDPPPGPRRRAGPPRPARPQDPDAEAEPRPGSGGARCRERPHASSASSSCSSSSRTRSASRRRSATARACTPT